MFQNSRIQYLRIETVEDKKQERGKPPQDEEGIQDFECNASVEQDEYSS